MVPVTENVIVEFSNKLLASRIAARNVQLPRESAHTLFPGKTSTVSAVLLTVNVAAEAWGDAKAISSARAPTSAQHFTRKLICKTTPTGKRMGLKIIPALWHNTGIYRGAEQQQWESVLTQRCVLLTGGESIAVYGPRSSSATC